MTRVFLFLATNIAIMVVLSITLSLLGFSGYLDAQGVNLNMQALLVYAAVFGMGGSFISLLMSKWSAKRMMRVQLIENPGNEQERWLVSTVHRMADQAGIGRPEVGIFPAGEMNAFATGASRNNALVAVSAGLLNGMRREEVEAVLGHEVSHVANGDMITLALVQGVVNTFVIFLSRVIGHLVDRVVFKNERGHGIAFWVTAIFAELVLGVLASIIVSWFSRKREFRADTGGAQLAGTGNMVAALERLRGGANQAELPDQMAAFGISGRFGGGFAHLFRSHPPLEQRIAALREQRGW